MKLNSTHVHSDQSSQSPHYSSSIALKLAPPLEESSVEDFSRRSHLSVPSHSIWKIKSGVVRTNAILDDGNILTLGFWGPGDIVGKAFSRVELYEIECLTKVQAISLPVEHCLSNSRLIPILQQSEELAVIRSYNSMDKKLSKFLLWLANKFGHTVETGNCIDLRLTHQDIADTLCSTRVTVTRLFGQLEDRGWIERQSVHKILLKRENSWQYEIFSD
jgi:CRP-like cAMP-binding protein